MKLCNPEKTTRRIFYDDLPYLRAKYAQPKNMEVIAIFYKPVISCRKIISNEIRLDYLLMMILKKLT